MTGAAAKKRHDKARRQRLKLEWDCKWRDGDGGWHPRMGWTTPRGAKRAMAQILDETGHVYVVYECRVCSLYHIRPDKRAWAALRASVLVQALEERTGNE